MPDYKELYLNLFRASEEAINLLIAAQRQCEDYYTDKLQSELTIFPILQVADNEE